MKDEDFYRILGVNRSDTHEKIKKAYRKLARELHPDTNKNNKSAEERFKKVSAAYAVLGDNDKREKYDKYGIDGLRDGFDPEMWRRYGGGFGGGRTHSNTGQGPFDAGGFTGFGAMEDIFESLFGQGAQRRSTRGQRSRKWGFEEKGAKIETTLEVELMDTILGRELQIVIPVEGNQKRLKVKIPKGIEEGQKIRLKEQGGVSQSNGKSGDLIIEIKVKSDKIYQRKELNLEKKENITIGKAYDGGVIEVDTPWGQVKMTIPPGTQGGQRMRLKGKGVKKGSNKGDLFVQLNVAIPTKRDKKTKKAIEKIEEMYE